MAGVDPSATSTVPEDKEAPCNICGRGWPYHHDSCAYKHTAIERGRYCEALELILTLYHSRLPEDLPTLPFQMKEVALRALERTASPVSESDVIAAAIAVATNEGLDNDWECVRASDLGRLRASLGLTLMAGASDE